MLLVEKVPMVRAMVRDLTQMITQNETHLSIEIVRIVKLPSGGAG